MELIFREDAYATSCAATVTVADERGIRLDRTVFYPNGGGQPGDTGLLRVAGATLRIVDTVKGDGPDDVIHVPEPGAALPAPGTPVEAEIDWDRRHRHMRMHTALHLVCAVLPGASITGAQVGAERSRVDFNVPTEGLDKEAIAAALNRLVAADTPVGSLWITDAELDANPDLIRTLTVKPPRGYGRVRLVDIAGVDRQPCGGTHVKRLGEIGGLDVVKIENKGKQNRRVIVALRD
ncbi:alanyl-tRNA editing protein [Azospirillum sp. YIM DDC1]|uniref:Alanine--tRNA ligase n=1 Tax=Azospirillum aestuarii TaxID=2802052 RepID=A0ABS1I0T1_9PROT|nr:alanyl-tRNA editing protein [Azospirillum aestuarii]MBK3772857.1 alanyl-tRNA editing protein [Azospirillum brasilense]MBK4720684.1 alanyl-tRNA editing protein [Azospirillum aestuarii]TWA88108.1 misacylated tRNA(Ala) deacylase [Azospirillum brasilense]